MRKLTPKQAEAVWEALSDPVDEAMMGNMHLNDVWDEMERRLAAITAKPGDKEFCQECDDRQESNIGPRQSCPICGESWLTFETVGCGHHDRVTPEGEPDGKVKFCLMGRKDDDETDIS